MKWLSLGSVLAMHNVLLAEHGGSSGVRDQGLLESALAKPRNRSVYTDATTFELAAAYCYGIVKNHPFVDGNKRTGFMSAYTFLSLNGHSLIASEPEVVLTIEQVAAGELSEATLATWFEKNCT